MFPYCAWVVYAVAAKLKKLVALTLDHTTLASFFASRKQSAPSRLLTNPTKEITVIWSAILESAKNSRNIKSHIKYALMLVSHLRIILRSGTVHSTNSSVPPPAIQLVTPASFHNGKYIIVHIAGGMMQSIKPTKCKQNLAKVRLFVFFVTGCKLLSHSTDHLADLILLILGQG